MILRVLTYSFILFSWSMLSCWSSHDDPQQLERDLSNVQFLQAKHGHKTDVMDAVNKLYPAAQNTLAIDLEGDCAPGEDPKDVYFETLKNTLKFGVFDHRLDKYSEYFRQSPNSFRSLIASEKQIVEEYFEGKKETPFYQFLRSRQMNPTRSILEDIVLSAWHIDHIRNQKGDAPILFVGRSGSLVQLALTMLNERLYEHENDRQDIYHISFSGTPDIENVRANAISQNAIKTLAKNFVTREKRDYFMDYCDRQKLHEIGDKLYLADIMGTGSSLNSMIKILGAVPDNYFKIPRTHCLIWFSWVLGFGLLKRHSHSFKNS